MKDRNSSNAAERVIFTATEDQLIDDLDVLVSRAAEGEDRAVGAIAIAFGPMLMQEARTELGELWQKDAGDVVLELHARLLAGQLVFPRIRGAAVPWMKRMTRKIARERLGKEEPEPEAAG